MMVRWAPSIAFVALIATSPTIYAEPTRPAPPLSGITYASEQTRALQADDAANPGMLWISRGEALWNTPAGTQNRACASCHIAKDAMKGVATRYPQIDARTKKTINLESRINECRVKNQNAPTLEYESEALLGITAYVAHQSRGLTRTAHASSSAEFLRGESLYKQRMGQMNLACMHCHDHNAGRTLLNEKISQGQSNAYPIYRLEWQGMGSLHRRLKSCMVGIRAEPFAPGSEEFLALELYLAWRGSGLLIETPGVRR